MLDSSCKATVGLNLIYDSELEVEIMPISASLLAISFETSLILFISVTDCYSWPILIFLLLWS